MAGESPPRRQPAGWDTASLRELAVGGISNGVFKQPSRVGRGVPLINVSDLYGDFGVALSNCELFDADAAELSRFRVRAGDIFFTRSSLNLAGIAHCNVLRESPEEAVYECHLMRVRPNQGRVLPALLALLCRGPAARSFFMARAKQTTMTTIAQPDVLPLEIPLPPLPEQRRIAEILDTLDHAIRKTEQVIAKLQQMKQGLLHDLLTRGIDENGELRDPERHPEQFKDSVLGRIPRGWGVQRLGDVVRSNGGLIQTGPFGSQLHAYEYVNNGGVPVIMPQDIQGERIDTANIARITERKAHELSRHRVQVDDAVFSRRGDLSRCVAVAEHEVGWLCGTGSLLVRLPASAVSSEWLASIYRHDLGQRQVLAQAVGSTMVNLNGKILASMLVPIPPPDEQRNCTKRVGVVRNRLASELGELEKLRTLKHGLMDDLLTGRVRVNAHAGATP